MIEIVDSVTVDVPRIADVAAGLVELVDSHQHEAGAAVTARLRKQSAQLQDGRKGGCAPEDDIALAHENLVKAGGVVCADNKVLDAVAVDIPSTAHRVARLVGAIAAREHDARAAVAACTGKQAAPARPWRESPSSGRTKRSSRPREVHP
jgi:hypothetical protein